MAGNTLSTQGTDLQKRKLVDVGLIRQMGVVRFTTSKRGALNQARSKRKEEHEYAHG